MALGLQPASQSQRPTSSVPTSGARSQLERSGKRGRGGCVSLRQPQRERVEQDVNRTRRVGAGGAARAASAASRTPPGLPRSSTHIAATSASKCVSRAESAFERLEASGRAEEQPSGVAAALLLQRDLSAQVLHLGSLQRVERASLDRDQQTECRVERAGVALRPGSREQALRTASGFGRQHRRALEERGRRGQAPAGLRSAGRALELLGDVLVGPRRGLGPMPGATVGIDLRIGGLRQRAGARPAAPRSDADR